MHERVERSRVFAQALTSIEGKDRHGAGRFADNLAANDGTVLVVDQVGDLHDFGSEASRF